MQEDSVLKNRVRELRVRLDMRQSDLAREVGVTRQTILAIEKGRLNPSINIALKAARVLREPVDYVFYLGHQPPEEAGNAINDPKDSATRKTPKPLWKLAAK